MMKYNSSTIVFLLMAFIANCQQYQIEIIPTNTPTSIRGLAALNDSVFWASGSNGYVGNSTDGGKSWLFKQIPGYDSAEFRDIEIINEKTILVMSSVQPACILKSTDKGITWKKVYEDNRPEAFLDAMDFVGKKGICVGDPINGKFLLLQTTNKGDSWQINEQCSAEDSIAAFAASGSTIQYLKKGHIFFGTGGNKTLLYYSENDGKSWQKTNVPLQSGAPSKGIFSIDFIDATIGAAVGGDYVSPNDYTGNFTMLVKNDSVWKSPLSTNPNGYRSCIKFINPYLLIACGTTGVDISKNLSWSNISLEGFNVIAVSPSTNTVLLAGNKGKIGKLKLN